MFAKKSEKIVLLFVIFAGCKKHECAELSWSAFVECG